MAQSGHRLPSPSLRESPDDVEGVALRCYARFVFKGDSSLPGLLRTLPYQHRYLA